MRVAALVLLLVLLGGGTACTTTHVPHTIEVDGSPIRKDAMHSLQAFIGAKKPLTVVEATNYILISDALVTWAHDQHDVNRTEMLEMVNILPSTYRTVAALMIEVIVFESEKLLPGLTTDADRNFVLGRITLATHEGVVLAVAPALQRSQSRAIVRASVRRNTEI